MTRLEEIQYADSVWTIIWSFAVYKFSLLNHPASILLVVVSFYIDSGVIFVIISNLNLLLAESSFSYVILYAD